MIAWDDVKYTPISDTKVILAYLADIGDTYYDDLPIAGESEPFKMDMPGTAGGAKIIFAPEAQVSKQHFKVELDIRFCFDVEAEDTNAALAKAEHFYDTMKHSWGENSDEVSWEDTETVRKSITIDCPR